MGTVMFDHSDPVQEARPTQEPPSFWMARRLAVDEQLQERMGNTFHELCTESVACLRTQMLWCEMVVQVGETCDASPAVLGVKALELELKRRVVNAAFITALWLDLEADIYPYRTRNALVQVLDRRTAEQLTFGQCTRLLKALADLRRSDPRLLVRSAVGQQLGKLHLGLMLVDGDFVQDLQAVVSRYRNRSAHRAMSPAEVSGFERILFGEHGGGLLPFLLRASRSPNLPLPTQTTGYRLV